MRRYIANPQTIDDLWNNAKFQSENVDSWVYLKDIECALIKLECLTEVLREIKTRKTLECLSKDLLEIKKTQAPQ